MDHLYMLLRIDNLDLISVFEYIPWTGNALEDELIVAAPRYV